MPIEAPDIPLQAMATGTVWRLNRGIVDIAAGRAAFPVIIECDTVRSAGPSRQVPPVYVTQP